MKFKIIENIEIIVESYKQVLNTIMRRQKDAIDNKVFEKMLEHFPKLENSISYNTTEEFIKDLAVTGGQNWMIKHKNEINLIDPNTRKFMFNLMKVPVDPGLIITGRTSGKP